MIYAQTDSVFIHFPGASPEGAVELGKRAAALVSGLGLGPQSWQGMRRGAGAAATACLVAGCRQPPQWMGQATTIAPGCSTKTPKAWQVEVFFRMQPSCHAGYPDDSHSHTLKSV